MSIKNLKIKNINAFINSKLCNKKLDISNKNNLLI